MKLKPPILKSKRVTVTFTLAEETKALLAKAKKATRLSIGEYIDRAVKTQCKADNVQ